MGHIITELETIMERVLIISKNEKSLQDVFETMTLEMTMELSPQQSMQLRSSRIPSAAAISLFSAFRLGKRGQMTIRLAMMGAELDKGPVNEALWGMADFAILDLDPTDIQNENLLRSKIPPDGKEIPCIIRGLDKTDPKDTELREKALIQWIQNNFSKYHFLPPEDKILSESLEWALSF